MCAVNFSKCRLAYRPLFLALISMGAVVFPSSTRAQQVDTKVFTAMRWRLIGPFRAGRVTAVAGVPGDPNVYYMGTPGGGVWKTTDGGDVWKPIFDQEHVASIGALALAPSNPDIIYVGTGEQTPGNGVYKSTDGGASWTNIGLKETRYIQAVIVDPRDPNIVIVGATGDFHAGPDRGVYKSKDGGRTWNKVLDTKDDVTGVVDMCVDPGNRRVLYAALETHGFRVPKPGEKPPQVVSAIYKSTDEGSTWKPVSGEGLPSGRLGRIGVVVAPGNKGRRVYAIVNQGFYRSDDAGATWQRSTTDPRVVGNGYFSRIFVDPGNADVVYVAQTSLYRSTDGGHTFEAYVGAPSGDDFHVLWIDPQDSARMLLGVDQGAIISRDGGRTWSSWYNQPTGQFYHISTDNAFPYHAYAAQQDSGTAAVASRSDYGEISDRDWYPIAGFEAAYIAADPLNPNIVYSEGWYGSILRFDRTTGQFATVFVRSKKYRSAGMEPLAFSPQDPHTLYLCAQFVLKTTDGGMSWQEISPDLTEKPKPAADKQGAPSSGSSGGFGAITTFSPSPVQADEMWAGTSNGNIQLTRDGGAAWTNVSPPSPASPGPGPAGSVSVVDASPHDAGTAYAVLGGGGFMAPPGPDIVRTHDYGRSWQKIVEGLPASEGVRVVREDPGRKGLLYAGTTTGVFVSFDDGDHWQSLQLNLPTATVTDLTVHGDDLVASTYGRALWILDDLTPLRQFDAQVAGSSVFLFHPETAWRVRWDNNQDTPLPIETPTGQNPPDGAILNYYFKTVPEGEITLTISDEQGKVVRQFSSAASTEPKMPPANAPEYWFAPPEVLPKAAGTNRFTWDLRYPSPPPLPYGYFGGLLDYTEYTMADHAIPGATPRHQPPGPLVTPGNYVVELKAGGQTLRETVAVKLDPRVQATGADLADQLDLERKIDGGMAVSYAAFHEVTALRAALAEREKNLPASGPTKDVSDAANAIDRKIITVENGTRSAPGLGPVNRDLARLATALGTADVRPSETARAAVQESCKALDGDLTAWSELNSKDVTAFNQTLEQHKMAALPVAATAEADPGCRAQ
jgi:photosystem II stability/assembly factor-like uncharacterized protein